MDVVFREVKAFLLATMACVMLIACGHGQNGATETDREAQASSKASPKLFLPASKQTKQELAQPLGVGEYAVTLNRAALAGLAPGKTLSIDIPEVGAYEVVYDKTVTHPSGNHTFIGHLKGNQDKTVVLTYDGKAVAGLILTQNEAVLAEMRNNKLVLRSALQSGLKQITDYGNDVVIPPERKNVKSLSRAGKKASSEDISSNTVIDLMILYTPGFAQLSSGSPRVYLDNLVELTNQAYVNSGINLSLRLVHAEQVAYNEDNDNAVALEDLRAQTNPAFSQVSSLRRQYGADLVSLVRPYKTSHVSEGIGYMPSSMDSFNPDAAYSAISFNSVYDLTLAHEIGHNLGQDHDRAHAIYTAPNHVHSYSYGYGISGKFGDIMSYIGPKVRQFSNPNSLCNGYPCGVSETDLANGANASLSISQTKSIVAAYMPTAGVPENGWWWSEEESGSGYAIEINNAGRMFMAAFTYANDGSPQWFVTMATSPDSKNFTGLLQSYANGQTFSGAYRSPTPKDAGTVKLQFSDSRHGVISWPDGHTTILKRFDIVPGGAENPGTPDFEIGWYWNPDESGRGFFFEEQQGHLFGAGFMYAENGKPIWYVISALGSDLRACRRSESYWLQYGNGQPFGGAYRAPVITNDKVLPLYLCLLDGYPYGVSMGLKVSSSPSMYRNLSRFSF